MFLNGEFFHIFWNSGLGGTLSQERHNLLLWSQLTEINWSTSEPQSRGTCPSYDQGQGKNILTAYILKKTKQSYILEYILCSMYLFLLFLFLATPWSMWDLSSLTRDGAQDLGSERMKSQPLDCQGIPFVVFKWSKLAGHKIKFSHDG